MKEVEYQRGDYIIKQGDDGDYFYLVDQGELECYRKIKKDDQSDTYLKTYYPGDTFGELALLYNAPRAVIYFF